MLLNSSDIGQKIEPKEKNMLLNSSDIGQKSEPKERIQKPTPPPFGLSFPLRKAKTINLDSF